MPKYLKDTDEAKDKIKQEYANKFLLKKSFGEGLYLFQMFMIDYYSRVKKQLKIDYDSFMIIQTTVSHNLYHSKGKKKKHSTYQEFQKSEWEKLIEENEVARDVAERHALKKLNSRLTMSSICLVTELPKETVRRKVKKLIKKNLLKVSKTEGIVLGRQYYSIFEAFVPETIVQISKLIKGWEKIGIIKNILNFKI